MSEKQGFIVDTNQYSGSWEREMCAFMTGHVGDCGTEKRTAEAYLEEFPLFPSVKKMEDEDGCRRPVEIYPTPGYWNNGLGFAFQSGQEAIALMEYQTYSQEYYRGHIERVENHRGKGIEGWTDDVIDREIKRLQEQIDRAMEKTEVTKHDSYQSIFIYLSAAPTAEQQAFLEKRAYAYAKKKGFEIIGFRLIGFDL